MHSYQAHLYWLIEQLWFTDEEMKQQAYFDLEQSFLDRWLTTLISYLSDDDQQTIAARIEQWATPEQVYEFLDATLDDIDTRNTQILTQFTDEYKSLMWL